MPSNVIRSWRWSNPNISEGSTPTGTVATNNVARSVSANASRIADFRPNPNIVGFTATIKGEDYVMSYGSKTYQPIITCGTGPFRYYWERSYDGFNYFGSSNSELYNFVIYPLNNGTRKVYLRLSVQDSQGRWTLAYYTITVPMGGGTGRIGTMIEVANNRVETAKEENKLIQVIYPNPANNHALVAVFLAESSPLKLSLINTQGQELTIIHQSELTGGLHEFDVPTQGMATGEYFVRATTTQRTESAKIIIQK